MESSVPASVPMKDLLALSAIEKIAVIGALWDSIEEGAAPIPAWQLEELDRREASHRATPEAAVTWEEVKERVRTSAHA